MEKQLWIRVCLSCIHFTKFWINSNGAFFSKRHEFSRCRTTPPVRKAGLPSSPSTFTPTFSSLLLRQSSGCSRLEQSPAERGPAAPRLCAKAGAPLCTARRVCMGLCPIACPPRLCPASGVCGRRAAASSRTLFSSGSCGPSGRCRCSDLCGCVPNSISTLPRGLNLIGSCSLFFGDTLGFICLFRTLKCFIHK